MKKTFKLADKIEVSRLGYGAMQLTGPGVFGEALDRPNALKVLQAAIAAGVDFIDTADAYGPYTNEVLVAEARRLAKPKHLVIATKSGLERPGPNQWTPNGNPEHIRQGVEGSLKRLGVDAIDLWQLHRIDSHFPVEKTLEPVAKAVAAGKIKHVGLSEVSIDDIKRAQKVVPIVSVQNLYNLADRKSEDVLNYTTEHGMAFIPWFPLSSGPHKFSGAIEAIAKKRAVSQAQIALAWLLKRADNILLIPGTKSLEHLHDNLGAAKIDLTEEEFRSLS